MAGDRIEWEGLVVEDPFCRQLEQMGWTWLRGDVDVPDLTERASFREVLLRGRLRRALHKINLDAQGRAWLDEARLDRAIRQLEQTAGLRLMEANRQATDLLVKGTVTEDTAGRAQPLRFIDYEQPRNNDFLVINQFKLELASGRGHLIADAVLFVNGIPLVVAEFKSPSLESPMAAGIDQLLRYSNQRRELYPEQFNESEGNERLFHTNQLLIASHFFEARVGSIGAPPEAFLEWTDTSPASDGLVTAEAAQSREGAEQAQAMTDAAKLLQAGGGESADRPGTPWFFRKDDKPPTGPKLASQELLVAGILRPEHLLDLMRSFILFQTADGKTRKVVARYQQFRAVHKTVHRLAEGRSRTRGADRDERGGIIWHTQGSGKSLTMVFLVRKMRTIPALQAFKVVVVTDRTDLEQQLKETAALSGEATRPSDVDLRTRETATERTQRILAEDSPDLVFAMIQKYQDHDARDESQTAKMTIERTERTPGENPRVERREVTFTENIAIQDFPELNRSDRILVLVDEAHRSQARQLHRNLRKALPNAAAVGFTGTPILACDKTQTHEIFGDFIDRYLLRDAELDGATVPIRYEGRAADIEIKDAKDLDTVFVDMFKGFTDAELAIIKARYAQEDDVLAAPKLIERKAADMLRHYVSVVMPEGYKAQVVATSREAAVTYRAALHVAKDALVHQLESLPAAVLAMDDDALSHESAETRMLVAAHPRLDLIRALDFATVVSGNHNDPESWKEWTDKAKQQTLVKRFKRRLEAAATDKADPLAILVVNNMLLTGFDAPVEQVMYLDRKIQAHDLLQAIARVNRTHGRKRCGYVVDYVGIAKSLSKALGDYDKDDIKGTGSDITVELSKLRERHKSILDVFLGRGITDLLGQVPQCVALLEDKRVRGDFINKLRLYYETLGMLEHRPEVPPEMFRDAKLLGFINKVAANLYRDLTLNLLGVPEKVRALIEKHISAQGVDPRIPPVTITDAEFENVIKGLKPGRARAMEMKHAARFHIASFEQNNPAYAKKMSDKLEEILKAFADRWDELERELKQFIATLKQGDQSEFPGLHPQKQVPFVRLVLAVAGRNAVFDHTRQTALIELTLKLMERIGGEIIRPGFWQTPVWRDDLTKKLTRDLIARAGLPDKSAAELAHQLVQLAKHNHVVLTQ